MEVENIGVADLEITNLIIPGSAPITTTFQLLKQLLPEIQFLFH